MKDQELDQLREVDESEELDGSSQNISNVNLSKLNSTLSRGSRWGNTRISLGVALTKAIEKDNIIEELKEDMDWVIEKYNVVDEENIGLKSQINELRLRLDEIH